MSVIRTGNYEGAILLHRSALHVLSSILGHSTTSKQSSIDISKSCAFIIDAGHAYGGIELTDYLTHETITSTGACIDGQQYCLVYLDSNAVECKSVCYNSGPYQKVCSDNKFSMPPGLHSLSDGNFGSITNEDLIKGSVRT